MHYYVLYIGFCKKKCIHKVLRSYSKNNNLFAIPAFVSYLRSYLLLLLYATVVFLVSENVDELVIKAQILAGGRGKGTFDNGFKGGVHLTKE